MESPFLAATQLFRQGRFDAVLREAAPHLAGPDAAAWLNLAAGAACALGRLDEAESHLRGLLDHMPDSAEVLSNLGSLLRDRGRFDEAEDVLRRALAIRPDFAAAYNNLGIVLHARGRAGEAGTAFERAIELDPANADAVRANLASVRIATGRLDEAQALLVNLLVAQPGNADLHCRLGMACLAAYRAEEAEAAFRRALALSPLHVGAQHGLAALLDRLGRSAEAEAAYRGALALAGPEGNAAARGDDANRRYELFYGLGNLLMRRSRRGEARTCFRRALAIKPEGTNAAGLAIHCSQYLCEWDEVARESAELEQAIARGAGAVVPSPLLSLPGFGADAQREVAARFAAATWRDEFARPPLVDPAHHPLRDGTGAGRLRVGYLSADLQEHATMHLMGGVFDAHNRARFAIHAYSYGPAAARDDYRRRVEAVCDGFRDLEAETDASAAALIAADGIDILVDLKGYTNQSRLGIQALRPAPVVVSWLGYPGSLGHPRLADYLIGDPVVTPLDHAAHYSERLALMPHCYQPNDSTRVIGEKPSRSEMGLPEAGVVFCSFNQSYKITRAMFDLWSRLLQAVPGSVLWLLELEAAARQNLRAAAQARGVEPSRLIFASPMPHAAHLGRLQCADLALDTFPYGSHTTGSDALWAGVPLVGRLGDTFASRVSASLLHAVGLPELVAETDEAFFELALDLATTPAKREAIRDHLARTRALAPLFDTRRFTRDLERLYLAIWEQHGRGADGPVVIAADEGPVPG